MHNCASISRCLAILLVPIFSYAHPHIFLDITASLQFDSNGLKGIQETWVFDEMYSMALMGTYDTDADGTLSPKEKENLFPEFLKSQELQWHTQLLNGSEKVTLKKAENWNAEFDGLQLSYTFFLPVNIEAKKDYSFVVLAIFDPTAFTAITYPLEKTTLQNPSDIVVDKLVDKLNDLKMFRGLIREQKGLFVRFKKR